jgi:hypothetical protein
MTTHPIKAAPDHHDAELVLKLYDLRRETVMRQSRSAIGQFLPRTWEDIQSVTQPANALNPAWRQCTSYWEMAYGMARFGIVNPDYLAENTGEGLFLFAKVEPHLERYRKEISPLAFHNAQWLLTNSTSARRLLEIIQGRLRKLMDATR